MKKVILIAVLLLATLGANAQQMPPGKWWRMPRVVQMLSLSEEQQTKLDGVFRAHANDLIDLRGAVEKQNIALRGELEQPQLSRKNIQQIAARLNEARGKLFERELMMLVDMRGVLSDSQWNRLRTTLENRIDNQRRQNPGPKRQRP